MKGKRKLKLKRYIGRIATTRDYSGRLARWHKGAQRRAAERRLARDYANDLRATCKCGRRKEPALMKITWSHRKPAATCGVCA